MKYQITYESKSMFANVPVRHMVVADNLEEVETVCKKIDELEDYKLIDVSHWFEDLDLCEEE